MKLFSIIIVNLIFISITSFAIEITNGQYKCEQTTVIAPNENLKEKTIEKKELNISVELDNNTTGYVPSNNDNWKEISLPLVNIYNEGDDFPFISIPSSSKKIEKETIYSVGGISTLYIFVTKFSNSSKNLSMQFETSGCFGGVTISNLKLVKNNNSKFILEISSKDEEESISDTLNCQLLHKK